MDLVTSSNILANLGCLNMVLKLTPMDTYYDRLDKKDSTSLAQANQACSPKIPRRNVK